MSIDIPVGTWGLNRWFRKCGIHHIHPDDLANLERLIPNGRLFQSEGNEGCYLRLRHDRSVYHVKPELFQPVPSPKCSFDEPVLFLKGGHIVQGKIRAIAWHHKKACPLYQVELNGKILSKRYWDEDFQHPAG